MKKLKAIGVGVLVTVLLAGCNNTPVNNAEGEASTKIEQDKQAKQASKEDAELQALLAKFQPLGEMPVPADNPMSANKVELGKKLYFDPRLSGNNKTSCMSCHVPGAGYGDNLPTFVGFEGFKGARNSPTIINAGYYTSNFWDGRAASLEEQALGPIQSEAEMNQNLDVLVKELKSVPAYVDEFKAVFNDEINAKNIAKALATFERTIVINDTKFDRFLKGDKGALTEQQIEGMKLFAGKANCMSCHAGPTLSDQSFHNIGIEGDDGRYGVTKQEADKGKFRTPALRGIAHTAPYMHDGSIKTLREVIEYYNKGGGAHPNKDPLMQPINLNDQEIDALVAFLEALSGEVPVVEPPKLP
ncbi:cytochrome-c peroxidase [Aneurinibacillus aneurinilyticus]|uniref:cytochrome-c peroxidase n=1 Tax=Aneurinibacillus aneurinilyticus TaxID=1391 RepID=UPI002E1C27A9|nr:cytochrome-c peroxidase [Aneurinibacillus aneurinilyticus]